MLRQKLIPKSYFLSPPPKPLENGALAGHTSEDGVRLSRRGFRFRNGVLVGERETRVSALCVGVVRSPAGFAGDGICQLQGSSLVLPATKGPSRLDFSNGPQVFEVSRCQTKRHGRTSQMSVFLQSSCERYRVPCGADGQSTGRVDGIRTRYFQILSLVL